MSAREPHYRTDLALIHHRGFGFHADACAPGVLGLLEPITGGIVVELGCGSGALTRHLAGAGHRVIATDASPAMLELARREATGADELRRLTLPSDPIPACDAVVSVGHVLNYLDDETAIDQVLIAAARALRPGGLFALDLCDLEYGEARKESPSYARVEDDWAVFTEFATPAPNRFVRTMTTFVRTEAGSWRRDDERHDNVLIDTSRVPALLAEHGVEAETRASFGREQLPAGLRVVVGRRV